MTAREFRASSERLHPKGRPLSVSHGQTFLVGVLSAAIGLMTFSAERTMASEEAIATVDIRGRQFQPDRIVLHQGHKTALILKNHDSEPHAFVPLDLFVGESLNVAGNGAPEFGPQGLKRVVIPSDGLVEIRFTPTRPGEYRYLCDMPGHEMKAVIVVE